MTYLHWEWRIVVLGVRGVVYAASWLSSGRLVCLQNEERLGSANNYFDSNMKKCGS